jgi:putative transposase
VCQAIRDELGARSQRSFDGVELGYLFLDASLFKLHVGLCAEPMLAACGICRDGAPVFIGLAAGGTESTDIWAKFLDGLNRRGLADAPLMISDRAAGLTAALESAFPRLLRQKCLIPRARNVLATVPVEVQAQIKDAYWPILDLGDLFESGTGLPSELVAVAQRCIDAFRREERPRVHCSDPLQGNQPRAAHSDLRFLSEHGTRHSNFIEYAVGETHRGSRRWPGADATSCPSLSGPCSTVPIAAGARSP